MALSRLQDGQRLGNRVFEGGKCLRIEPSQRREDVTSEGSIVSTALENSPA